MVYFAQEPEHQFGMARSDLAIFGQDHAYQEEIVATCEALSAELGIAYEASDGRRYTGDRARAVALISLDWQGIPLRLTVFDRRDERAALKTTPAGRVAPRAGIAEVSALVQAGHGARAA
jgi:hypothetical protein